MQQIALVVDDSRVARMTLSKLLVAHGLKVIELGSGEDALVYLQDDNVKPDIIFMDVMMGGMDGLMVTQKIKAIDSLKNIPIVICSGHDTDADRAKSKAVGAVATLTKPPKVEALDALITALEQHLVSAEKEVVATPVIDSATLLAELMVKIEQDIMPAVQQKLRETTEAVSRQVAADTAERRIADHVSVVAKNAPEPAAVIDQDALFSKIVNTVEHDLLPKIHKDIREMTEDISQQIAADTTEERIPGQVKKVIDVLLPELTEQVLVQAHQATEEIANTVAKHAAHEAVASSAEKAVQNVIEEFDLSAKIAAILNMEGEVWLHRHEQLVLDLLMAQIEDKFAPMVMKYLNDHLTQMIAPIAHTVVEEALVNTGSETELPSHLNDIDDGLSELKQQVSILKMVVIGLGGMVLMLAGTIFL